MWCVDGCRRRVCVCNVMQNINDSEWTNKEWKKDCLERIIWAATFSMERLESQHMHPIYCSVCVCVSACVLIQCKHINSSSSLFIWFCSHYCYSRWVTVLLPAAKLRIDVCVCECVCLCTCVCAHLLNDHTQRTVEDNAIVYDSVLAEFMWPYWPMAIMH